MVWRRQENWRRNSNGCQALPPSRNPFSSYAAGFWPRSGGPGTRRRGATQLAGCGVVETHAALVRRRGPYHDLHAQQSSIIARFPPKNLAKAIFDRPPSSDVFKSNPIPLDDGPQANSPKSPIRSYLSGPSWVVFAVPDGTTLPLSRQAAARFQRPAPAGAVRRGGIGFRPLVAHHGGMKDSCSLQRGPSRHAEKPATPRRRHGMRPVSRFLPLVHQSDLDPRCHQLAPTAAWARTSYPTGANCSIPSFWRASGSSRSRCPSCTT